MRSGGDPDAPCRWSLLPPWETVSILGRAATGDRLRATLARSGAADDRPPPPPRLVTQPTSSPTATGRAARRLARAALVLGVLLRLLLALVNEEGNDPHLPVISTIAFEHRFPAKDEAWEAFQPKLYHLTVAAVWQLVPTRSTPGLTRVAQLVSCVGGVL